MKKTGFICFALFFLSTTLFFGEKTDPGFYFYQDIAGSYNPLGLMAATKIYYRFPLIKEEGILWESTHIDAGIVNMVSPAFDALSGFITIEPIAVFNISARYGIIGIYKALGFGFNTLQSYSDNHSPSALAKLSQSDASGSWAVIEPTIQIQIGPWIAVNTFTVNYWDMNTPSYFYEQYDDCIQKNKDFCLVNNTYVFYQFTDAFMTGLNNMFLTVPSSAQIKERLSAAGIYTAQFGKDFSGYAVLMLGTFLIDPNYQYAVPYLAVQAGLTVKL